MNFTKHANNKKIKSLHSGTKKVTTLVSTGFFRLFVLALIIVIAIMVSTVFGITKSILDSVPEVNFENMIPEGYASFIRNEQGEIVQELSVGDANRIYVESDQIPKHVKDAFIAIEDERFYQHNGIDVKGIFRAFFVNLKEKNLSEGASTITQQVIKNNVLTSDVTFTRKIQEQYLAMKAEEILEKDQILELYLNTAALGKGTLGVQAASKRYFNKDVTNLTIAEAAVLASITKYPENFDPVNHPENNRGRQKLILSYMYKQGLITEAEYENAKMEDVYSNIQIVNSKFEENTNYTYFVDETIRRVISDLEIQGYTTTQATNLIYRGGLNIYITQDEVMQEVVDRAYNDESNFPALNDDYKAYLQFTLSAKTSEGVKHFYKEEVLRTDEEAMEYMEQLKNEWISPEDEILAEKYYIIPQPQSAFVLMDYHTGHVKAIASGRGPKQGNNVFDRATQAKRQPGSTFKVLAAYLPAIDQRGFTLAKVYDDSPFTIDMPGAGSYIPRNWYNNQKFNYWGLTPIRTGIQWSMNILAVKTIFDIGIDTGFETLKSLGFTTLVDNEKRGDNTYTDRVLSLPLGGLTDGVTLLELTAAYGAIANNGTYIEPVFYTKVLNHDGSILLTKEPATRTVMKETTAFLLTSAMQSVVSSGTGGTANFSGMHIAGKTGTTSDSKDQTFVGYTPYYIAGVWLGHDQPEKMIHYKSYHTAIWKVIMEELHLELPDKPFEVPSGITSANVCSISGKLPVAGLCDKDPRGSTVKSEYFAVGTVPTEPCDIHVTADVCSVSGLFPTEYCPAEFIEEKVFTSREEPLNPESWDPANPPRIKDYQYELPITMDNEYCNLHTAEIMGSPYVILDENGVPKIDPDLVPPEDSPREESEGDD